MFTHQEQNQLVHLFKRKDTDGLRRFFQSRDSGDVDEEFEVAFQQLESSVLGDKLEKLFNSKVCRLRPVHMAVIHGDIPTLQMLIRTKNADLNQYMLVPRSQIKYLPATSFSSHSKAIPVMTALHLAAYLNRGPATDVLVKSGAMIFIKDQIYKMNALDIALKQISYEAVKIFIMGRSQIGDVRCRCKSSLRSILLDGTEVIDGNWEIVNGFLKLIPAAMDADDRGKGTLLQALMDTMNMRSSDAVGALQVLAERKYKFDVKLGFYQDTFVHMAASRCLPELCEFLIAQGLDVNAKNKRGETPMHHLMFYGLGNTDSSMTTFEALIKHEADLSIVTKSGLDTFGAAVVSGKNAFVVHMLDIDEAFSNYLVESPLQFYVRRGIMTGPTLRAFVDKGHKTDCVDSDRRGLMHTLLTRFCWGDELKRYRCLLDLALLKGCGVSMDSRDKEGRTPLMVAVALNMHMDIIRQLAATSPNIECIDHSGMNALDIAMQFFENSFNDWTSDVKINEDLIKCLVSYGCPPKIQYVTSALEQHDHRTLEALLCKDNLIEEVKVAEPAILLRLSHYIGDQASVCPLIERLITKYGLDINYMESDKCLIHVVVAECCRQDNNQNKTAVKLLNFLLSRPELDLTVEVSVLWDGTMTPLESAVFSENSYVASRILDHGSPVNESNVLRIALESTRNRIIPVMKVFYKSGYANLVRSYVEQASKIATDWDEPQDFDKLNAWMACQDTNAMDEVDIETKLSTLAAQKVHAAFGSEKGREIAESQELPDHLVRSLTTGRR